MNKFQFSQCLILILSFSYLLAQPSCVEKAKINEECIPPKCYCGSTDPYFAKLPNFGNLTMNQIPQFVLMSIDDCVNSDYTLVINSLQQLKCNKNSQNPVPMTLFVWEQWTGFDLVTDFYNQGCEIAIHSMTHSTGTFTDIDTWLAEMLEAKDVYHTQAGIPFEDMVGWRAPFIAYNEAMWMALYQGGFHYDTSFISYCQPYGYAFNYSSQLWPYTLDNLKIETDYREGIPYQEPIRGVMEVPIWGLYDQNSNQLGAMDTGFDLQLFKDIITAKKTNNKAPFGMFHHLGFFQSNLNGVKQLISWCLEDPQIFIVTYRQLIEWMKNPVPWDQLNNQPYMQPKPQIQHPAGVVTCFPQDAQFFTSHFPCPAVNPQLVVNQTVRVNLKRNSIGTSTASCSTQPYQLCSSQSTWAQGQTCFHQNKYWQSYWGSWGLPPSAEWRDVGSCITNLEGGEIQINNKNYQISSYQVLLGNSLTVNFVPYNGFAVDYVLINNENKGAITSYTFTSLQTTQSVEVFFKQSTTTQPSTYTITASNSFGCTISPSSLNVQSGSSQTFSIVTANSSCQITGIMVDGSQQSATSSYTFNNINTNHAISPVCSCTYPITVLDSPGCTINPSSSVNVQYNQNQVFSISPQTNCQIQSVVVDSTDSGIVSSYTFNNVQTAHQIGAICSCSTPTNQYSVQSQTSGCTMTPLGTQSVNEGSSVTFSITPPSGCAISSIAVNNVQQTIQQTNQYSLTLNNIQANTIVASTCTCPIIYTVSSSTTGCVMTPTGTQSVNEGSSVSFTITPSSGCSISSILVNNSPQALVSPLTITNIQSNTNVLSTCTCPVTYTVTSSTTGCTMSPLGTQTVQQGFSVTFTATPSSGCSLSTIKVNTVSQPLQSPFTVSNIQTNTNVVTTCTCPVLYYVTSSTSGCNMSPLGVTSVVSGGSQSFAISANTGCSITKILVGTSNKTITNNQSMTYILSNILANKTVSTTCTCQSTQYTVTSQTTACNMSPLGNTLVNSGGSVQYSISANTGCNISSLLLDGVSQTITNLASMTYSVSGVTSNKVLASTCTCSSTLSAECSKPVWSGQAFTTGQVAVDPDNHYAYKALWWTNTQPKYNNGWVLSDYCGNPPVCAIEWIPNAIYNAGNFVKYAVNGVYYKYKANWFSESTQVPENNSVWTKSSC